MSRRLWVAAAAIVVLAALGFVATRFGAPIVRKWTAPGDVAAVPTARAERSEFVRAIHADGFLAPETATILTAPPTARTGRKIAWLAPDGEHVREGDVVIRFDATDMERSLADGIDARASASEQIRKKRVEDDAAIENLHRDAAFAEVEVRYAEEFQSKDELVFSRMEIIESQIDSDLANRRRDNALVRSDIRADLASVEVDLLELERRRAQTKIREAETDLRDLEVRAPHDGIFVLAGNSDEAPQVGQIVWRGQPLAEIPQLDRMKAEVYVLEADAGGLEEGMAANVVLEAHPDARTRAAIRQIASFAKRRVRWSPVQYFQVTLEIDGSDPDTMKPGQRVRAEIEVERLEDVVTVPREAVFRGEEGEHHVFLYRGGRYESVAVEIGSAALGRVVVTSGIEAGDRVALRDPTEEIEEDEPAPSAAPAPGGAMG